MLKQLKSGIYKNSFMQQEFEKIAAQIGNCEFSYRDFKFSAHISARIPASEYKLKIHYKEHLIFVENEFGQTDMGKFAVDLMFSNIPVFEITTRSHFVKFFSRDKTTFKINCQNDTLSDYLQRRISMCKLDEIAKTNPFEPHIFTSTTTKSMKVITSYHLKFKDRTEALLALVDFYKSLIDYSVRKNKVIF